MTDLLGKLTSSGIMIGTRFNDNLTITDGDDRVLYTGAGNDSISIEISSSTNSPGSIIFSGSGDDFIKSGGGNGIKGEEGNDTISYESVLQSVNVDLENNIGNAGEKIDILFSIENVIGSDYNDTITGNFADNKITGGAGNDTLIGGSGDDTLDGGTGVDVYKFTSDGLSGNGVDTIIDSDGGSIVIDGAVVSGTDHAIGAGKYALISNGSVYTLEKVANAAGGNDLKISINDNSKEQIIIKDFTDGDFAISTSNLQIDTPKTDHVFEPVVICANDNYIYNNIAA